MDTTATAWFPRRIEALDEIADFVSRFGQGNRFSEEILFSLQLVIEEVFTNMLKYEPMATSDVRIVLRTVPSAVEAQISGFGVEPFDITQAPDVDLAEAARRRATGGRGIALIRQLMDHLQYEYACGTSTLTMRKALS